MSRTVSLMAGVGHQNRKLEYRTPRGVSGRMKDPIDGSGKWPLATSKPRLGSKSAAVVIQTSSHPTGQVTRKPPRPLHPWFVQEAPRITAYSSCRVEGRKGGA